MSPARAAGRVVFAGLAFGIGWTVYLLGAILMPYDGLFGLVFQPVLGALASVLGVGLALAIGLLLKAPGLRSLWGSRNAAALGLLSAGILLFGYALGLRGTFVDPETGASFEGLHAGAALGSWFALIFVVANWPFSTRDSKRSTP